MSVDDLIARLVAMREEYGGSCLVECRNEAGEFDVAEEVQATHYGRSKELKWRIFIDV